MFSIYRLTKLTAKSLLIKINKNP